MYDEDIDAESIGDRLFSSFLAAPEAMPEADLLALSGDSRLAKPGPFPSGLIRRVTKAWTTPMRQLTGAQVRVLVGQQFGLPWLAAPVAAFLVRHPTAECDLYPGDLMRAALRAHKGFLEFAPAETRALLACDFGWMAQVYDFDPDGVLYREATDDLTSARRLAGAS